MKKFIIVFAIVIALIVSTVCITYFYSITVRDTGGVHMDGYRGVPFVFNPTLEQRARRNPTFYPPVARELPDGFVSLAEANRLATEFSIWYFNFSFSIIGVWDRIDLSVRPDSTEFLIFQNQLFIDAEVFNTILVELRELEKNTRLKYINDKYQMEE